MSYFYSIGEYSRATDWREYVYDTLHEAEIRVFDPTENSTEHYKFPKEYNGGVIYQNYTYLRNCDILLVNLDMIEDSIGSVWEMSIAWAEHKPVIAFGECEKWRDRPHFQSLITVKTDTVEEACDYIISMYSQKI